MKLDENLPIELVEHFMAKGHDVDTVPLEGLTGRADDAVFEAVQTAGRLFITQDLDFSDIRRFKPGSHAGILLLRMRIPSRRAIVECFYRLLQEQNVESWRGCFVVLGDQKLRVLRP